MIYTIKIKMLFIWKYIDSTACTMQRYLTHQQFIPFIDIRKISMACVMKLPIENTYDWYYTHIRNLIISK